MKPQKLQLKVTKINWLTDKVIDVSFDMVEPKQIEFVSGQHISLIVGENTSRPYCLYTSPSNDTSVGITVSAGHDGLGANYLKNLKVGDEVDAFGPVGRLALSSEHKDKIVFVTTGTGISPLISMLYSLVEQNVSSDIDLYFGLRNEEDLFYEDKLQDFKNSLKNFDYKLVYSRPSEDWTGLTGYVTDHIEPEDAQNTQFYIVGHKSMVESLKEKLLGLGVPEDNIIA